MGGGEGFIYNRGYNCEYNRAGGGWRMHQKYVKFASIILHRDFIILA
jgi:hypothetical protein